MGQIIKILKYLFIFLLIISCKNEEKNNLKVAKGKVIDDRIISHNFPDTVKINTLVEGSIQYDIKNIEYKKNMINDRFIELLISTSINKTLAGYDEINNNIINVR